MSENPPIPTRPNWHATAFFGLHYDLHASAEDTALGRDLTCEHLRAELEKVRPDWVQCDGKGHPGLASYPTAVGVAAPGIVADALRVHRDVTRELGIPLSVHFSGIWDDAAMAAHPDWRLVPLAAAAPAPAGQTEAGNVRTDTPERGRACLSSPYTEAYMIPQLLEIVDRYDVDGFWVDGENWAAGLCYCARCRALFAAEHAGAAAPTAATQPLWAEWTGFHRRLFVRHVRRYTEAVHARKPSCLVCSNWLYTARQPEPIAVPVDYLSGDFDHDFGAERAAVEGRMLDGRGLPWDLMAWSFLTGEDSFDGWTTKTLPHLCQELAEVLACGGAVILFDNPQRSGHLVGWHQDLFAEVAGFCRARQAVSQGTASVPQVAVLHGAAAYYAHNDPPYGMGRATEAVEGAVHALLDAGYHVDLLAEDALLRRLGEYPLVVIPEQDPLADAVVAALPGYVAAGGRLLLSGAHVAARLGELAGVAPDGEPREGYRYLPAGGGAVTVAGPWQPVALLDSAEALPLLDGQEPSRDAAGTPAATIRAWGEGRVAAIHGPAFAAYFRTRYPRLREVLAAVMALAWDAPLVRLEAPGPVALTLRRREGQLLVHLLNRAVAPPTGRHGRMVERVPPQGPVTVRLRCDKPSRVYAVPDDPRLEACWEDGLLTATLPALGIHAAIVVAGVGAGAG